MRAIVDLVDSVAGTWARTVRMLVIGGIVVAGLFLLMVSFTAPKVVDNVGERVERISDKAMQAAREEARAHALAEEGWGYSDTNAEAANSPPDDFSEGRGEPYGGDWGAPSE